MDRLEEMPFRPYSGHATGKTAYRDAHWLVGLALELYQQSEDEQTLVDEVQWRQSRRALAAELSALQVIGRPLQAAVR